MNIAGLGVRQIQRRIRSYNYSRDSGIQVCALIYLTSLIANLLLKVWLSKIIIYKLKVISLLKVILLVIYLCMLSTGKCKDIMILH